MCGRRPRRDLRWRLRYTPRSKKVPRVGPDPPRKTAAPRKELATRGRKGFLGRWTRRLWSSQADHSPMCKNPQSFQRRCTNTFHLPWAGG